MKKGLRPSMHVPCGEFRCSDSCPDEEGIKTPQGTRVFGDRRDVRTLALMKKGLRPNTADVTGSVVFGLLP